jgi:hypothetical protein
MVILVVMLDTFLDVLSRPQGIKLRNVERMVERDMTVYG